MHHIQPPLLHGRSGICRVANARCRRSPKATSCVSLVLAGLIWLQGTAPKCCAEDAESGITVEVILDSQSIRFPDPIYGYLRIRNTGRQQRFMPLLLSTGIEIRAVCGEASVTQEYAPGFGGYVLTLAEPGESRMLPFMLNYGHREFASCLLDGGEILVHAEVQAKPTKSIKAEDKGKPSIGYSETGMLLGIHASPVEVSVDIKDTVASQNSSDFASNITAPGSWPSKERGPRLFDWDPEQQGFSLYYVNAVFVDKLVPVLRIYPQRDHAILSEIDRQTATWRSLSIRKAILNHLESGRDLMSGKTTVDHILGVLDGAGPAEAHFLLQQSFRLLAQYPEESSPEELRAIRPILQYLFDRAAEKHPDLDFEGYQSR